MSRSVLSSAFVSAALAAGLIAAHPAESRAELIKLDLLTKSCGDKSAVARADCEGYIAGIADMLEDQHAICLGDAKLKSVRELVVGYLQSHHYAAETKGMTAAVEALKAGYPCKKP
jgi:hypothetical protein